MKLFAGSSNPKLAGKIARELGADLAKVELSKFPNGEKRVVVKEERVGKRAILVQSLSYPPDEMLVETALLADALKRMGVEELVGVVPWLGYAKQDKVFQPGEPLSVKVVARLLQVAGFSKVVTLELHNPSIVGFFEIPLVELSARPLFVEYFGKSLERENSIVVAPDAGAVKASTSFANTLGVQVVYMDKKRDLDSGKVEVVGMSGEVEGKEALIVDDNLVTGSTLLETGRVLKQAGATRVRVGVTHHLDVPGVQDKIEKSKEIDELVVTDTVMRQHAGTLARQREKKLKVLSVARMIAAELGE